MAWWVGIDENGLGPRLGPMLVTAVVAKVNRAGAHVLGKEPKTLLHERLDDSKALVDHHHIALGEAWARALCGRMGIAASSPNDIIRGLSLYSEDVLLAPCPTHVAEQCWNLHADGFEADSEQVRIASRDFDDLYAHGLDVVWGRTAIVCTKRINDARSQGRGRFDLDLHTMEELIEAARARAQGDLVAVCGKVGGIQRYPERFRLLSSRTCETLREERACSSYRVSGIGKVHFMRDADSQNPLVALASLVGKYAREVLMKRIAHHYRPELPNFISVSGYNDPVTARFVEATQLIRRTWNVDDDCFARRQASDLKSEDSG